MAEQQPSLLKRIKSFSSSISFKGVDKKPTEDAHKKTRLSSYEKNNASSDTKNKIRKYIYEQIKDYTPGGALFRRSMQEKKVSFLGSFSSKAQEDARLYNEVVKEFREKIIPIANQMKQDPNYERLPLLKKGCSEYIFVENGVKCKASNASITPGKPTILSTTSQKQALTSVKSAKTSELIEVAEEIRNLTDDPEEKLDSKELAKKYTKYKEDMKKAISDEVKRNQDLYGWLDSDALPNADNSSLAEESKLPPHQSRVSRTQSQRAVNDTEKIKQEIRRTQSESAIHTSKAPDLKTAENLRVIREGWGIKAKGNHPAR
ncbi:MAG: hypothetical protein SFT91_05205 [Rickettsiaceae bacterium]|nr:hypothetical protein [Rickettsiaceae bacterium]